MNNYYKSGCWNVICQVCGRKYKSDQIKKRWDGLLVCEEDYENRNILDFMRMPSDIQSVPYQNPEPADVFTFFCYIDNRIGGADIYTADCMEAGAG